MDSRELERRIASLSPRVQQVYHLLAEGATTAQIMSTLDLTKSTVDTDRSIIYAELGVKRQTQLIIQRQNLIKARRQEEDKPLKKVRRELRRTDHDDDGDIN